MKETIYNLLAQQGDMTWQQIIMHILVSAVIGLFIFISYVISHKGTIYSKKFGVTLIVLTVMTGTVMTVIGNNIALSLGMVGALSIVRFRTAIKDSRDTVYIFLTVVVGLTFGVGDYITAGIGSAIVFLILLVLGRIKNESRMLLIVRGARSTDKRIMSVVSEYFSRRIDLRVENTTEQTVELIYEIPLKIFEKASNRAESIADCLYEIEHVEYVNVVAQDDDISN